MKGMMRFVGARKDFLYDYIIRSVMVICLAYAIIRGSQHAFRSMS